LQAKNGNGGLPFQKAFHKIHDADVEAPARRGRAVLPVSGRLIVMCLSRPGG
jgi:hypothetical protein